jgi:heat-inducible transcriptional repressor
VSDELTDRQRHILALVVEAYVASGVPVGSKQLAGSEGLEVASSTVRYELARLEEAGYLDHPHTSAGRVPTDQGYRYYAERIVRERPAAAPAVIKDALEAVQPRREIDTALAHLADALGRVNSLLGVVTAPAPSAATIKHVEVLQLQPQLVMVVVITSTGNVGKRIFSFDEVVDQGFVEWAGAFLNERSAGMPVGSRLLETRLEEPGLSAAEHAFVTALAPALLELVDDEAELLFVGGQAQVLAERRATDLDAVDALMRTLEERYALLGLLRTALAQREVYLRIGSDFGRSDLTGASMVAANYGIARRNLGTVSVLGPTRMDYRLAISTVREAAGLLSDYVEEVYE